MTVHIKSESELFSLIKSAKLALVDYFATWCAPCQMLSKELEKVEESTGDITIIKVDCDEFTSLAQKSGVSSIPHVVLYKEGKELGHFVGVRTYKEVIEFINERTK